MAIPRRRSTVSPSAPDGRLTRLDAEQRLCGGPYDPRHCLTLEGSTLATWQAERAAQIAALLAEGKVE
jgi:hypothetical protein